MNKITKIVFLTCLTSIIILLIIFFLYSNKRTSTIDDNFVFLGDSITNGYNLDEYYPEYPTVKSGVNGYKTQDILNNMNNMVYIYNPSKVFLLIGINDIHAGKSKEYIINNIEKIIDNIKENRKNAKIYVESIYPVNSKIRSNSKNDFTIEVNKEIKKLCKEKNIVYINIHDLLIDNNGDLKKKYTTDGLHLSEDGYKVVTKEIKKYLK
mgnify:FL=1